MTDRTIDTTETKESRIYRLRWRTLVVIALSVLVIVLDATVMNVALPTIQRELNATNSELLWMVNGYTMIFGALMLTTGALRGNRLGRVRLLQAGIAVFGLSSIGAYLSGTATHLIIWRFFMGAGAAMMLPAAPSLLSPTYSPRKKGAGLSGCGRALMPSGIALGTHYRRRAGTELQLELDFSD